MILPVLVAEETGTIAFTGVDEDAVVVVLVLYDNNGKIEELVARGTIEELELVPPAALTTGAAAELVGGAEEEDAALTDVGNEAETGAATEEDGADAAPGAEEPPALEQVEPVAHFVYMESAEGPPQSSLALPLQGMLQFPRIPA